MSRRTVPSVTLRAAVVLQAALLGLAGCPGDGWDLHDPAFTWAAWADLQPTGVARPEHPRPDFRRERWQSLNGEWGFQLDPGDVGLDEGWEQPGTAFDRTIVVPYPWTSALSGVNEDTGDTGGIGWYRRTFTLANGLGEGSRHVHLVIGAADWHTLVFLNGAPVAEHHNGYLPIRVDLADHLVDGENELVVRVEDVGNGAEYPHGKQGTPWYAQVAGIWQTVYLEEAAATTLSSLRLLPVAGTGDTFEVRGEVRGPLAHCVLRLYAQGDDAPLGRWKIEDDRFTEEVAVPGIEPWSPAAPNLTEIEARLRCDGSTDVVRTWAAYRTVERAPVPGRGYEAVHLNGQPVYLRGVLVQGYHPDGHYTYPDDQQIHDDLVAARDAGYNLVRLHIKVEEPRVLHWADRLGLLVDYDVPCWGVFPILSGDSPDARRRWQETMEGMFLRDGNHPSVIWWTLFNEDWGFLGLDGVYETDAEKQAYVKEMLARARELDPSRLIEEHSTLRKDHVAGGDVNSFHLYAESPESFAEALTEWTDGCYPGSSHNFVEGEAQDGAPLMNTEYGPFSIELGMEAWQEDRDVSWGLRVLTSILRRSPKLVGYVYTELYDVEFEHNGLADYDRTPKELGYPAGLGAAHVNAADFVGFVEPAFRIAQGAPLEVTPFVSRWSAPEAAGTLRLTLFDVHDTAQASPLEVAVDAPLYDVTLLAAVTVEAPTDLTGTAYVLAEWLAPDDTVVGAGYLPGEIVAAAPPATTCGVDRCDVVVALGDCFGELDPTATGLVDGATQSIGFVGEGALFCPVEIPLAARLAGAVTVRLEAEMAANVEGAPQTTADARPGAVDVTLDGSPLGTVALPPDRADSRGVLSHLNGAIPRGGYGDVVTSDTLDASGLPTTMALVITAHGADANGCILYGDRLGRYDLAPTVVIQW